MQDLVTAAIEHFKLNVVEIRPVEESYSSTVKILILQNQEMRVLKIPFSTVKFAREKRSLEMLQGKLPVPKLIADWQPNDITAGVLLISFLPGQALAGGITSELSFELGVLLAQLHLHRSDTFGDEFQRAEAATSNWWAMLEQKFQSWQPLCKEVMPSDLFESALRKFEEFYADLPEPDGPCLVHFDYRPGNVLVENGHITGLIDFESCRGGSADLDFTKIQEDVWEKFPETREPFLRGYSSIRPLPNLKETLPFYELYHAFGGVGWSVNRGRIHDDPFFLRNMRKLKLLAN